MASISTAARFSAIASDPLRSFKYYAEFSVAGSQPFSTKIIDSGGQAGAAVGTSSGFVGGFTQISGLNINIQDITYREGGYNTTAHHLPGLATFPPVTFQRGVLYGNDQAQVWMRGLFAAAAGSGFAINAASTFRTDVKIFVLDHPGFDQNIPKLGFKLHNAWISNLNYSDLNSVSSEVLFESMTLVHEGLVPFFTDSSGNAIIGESLI